MKQIKATAHFALRSAKAKATTINFVVYVDGKQHVMSTKCKVKPCQWDRKKEQCKVSPSYEAIDNYNNKVANDTIKVYMDKFYKYTMMLCNGGNNVELFNEVFMKKEETGSKPIKKEKTAIATITKIMVKEQSNVSEGTFKQYSGTLNKVAVYLKEVGKEDITIKRFAKQNIINGFSKWLKENTKDRKSKGVLSIKTYNNTMGRIKTLLSWCVKHRKIDNTIYNNLVFNKVIDKTKDIAFHLTNDEVMAIYYYKPQDAKEELAKDIFLIECTTGLRISDIHQLSSETIKCNPKTNKWRIDLTDKKEGKNIDAPLLFQIAKEILVDKYKCNIPSFKDSDINLTIKDIAKECGLDREIPLDKQSATGKKETERKPIYEVIKTHVGRHTFDVLCITNLHMSYEEISRYSGHGAKMVDYYTKQLKATAFEDVEYIKKNNPKYYVWSIKEIEELNKKQNITSKQENALDALFAYSLLKHVDEIRKETDINIIQLKETKQAISILKDVSKLSSYKEADSFKDADKVASLDDIVTLLSFRYRDIELYKLYQYKEKKLGIIKECMTEEYILRMWQDINYKGAMNVVNDILKEKGQNPNDFTDEYKEKWAVQYLEEI